MASHRAAKCKAVASRAETALQSKEHNNSLHKLPLKNSKTIKSRNANDSSKQRTWSLFTMDTIDNSGRSLVVGRGAKFVSQYCHSERKRMLSSWLTPRVFIELVGLLVLIVCVKNSAVAHDSLANASNQLNQPPAIYSYSASELDEAPGPLLSHRLNRPYSWTNQRLARLMADPLGQDQTQADRQEAAGLSGGGAYTGDLSLLYTQQIKTKANSQKGANRGRTSNRSNRRQRPSSTNVGTKRATGVKTRSWAAASPSVVVAAPNQFHGHNRTLVQASRRQSGGKRKNLVCYYGTWAVYRPDGGKFAVEDIDPFLCTHVIYGFTGLSYDNLIKPLDPWNDLEDNYGKGAMKRFTNLKRINPDLKTIVAIGGWNEGSIKYSKMASDPEARARFVESVVQFLTKYNFDGLDLDWEYPGSRGGASYDKQNFVKLLKELHDAFQPHRYLLTAAVSAGKWFIDPAYDIPQVSKYLDLINLMAYDYHGGWESKTGHNAPLFSSRQHDRSGDEQMLNVNWSVNYWLQMGAPREKLMLGVGSYGRSFTLDKQQVNGVNAPASQKGRAGPYTREPGSLGYNELCESFKRSPNAWTIVRDPDYLAPYAYDQERQWVGYDDVESLALKAQFAKSMGLGGMMMWSIETDDFRGSCHNEKFPLLNTIRRVMDGSAGGQPLKPPPGPGPNKPNTNNNNNNGASTTTRRPSGGGGAGGGSSQRPTTSTRRPDGGGHEVEEEQQRPIGTTSTTTRRPRPPTTTAISVTSRPSTSGPTSARPPTPQPTTSATTKRPAQESGAATCRESGMFADPRNCRKFIRCVQMGAALQEFNFDCPPGTGFNEQQQYCDHLYNVPQCNSNNKWLVSTARATPAAAAPATKTLESEPDSELVARTPNLWTANGSRVTIVNSNNQPQRHQLVPLLAVANNHYPRPYYNFYLANKQPQAPLIVQWR